jgi:hypothetical protein
MGEFKNIYPKSCILCSRHFRFSVDTKIHVINIIHVAQTQSEMLHVINIFHVAQTQSEMLHVINIIHVAQTQSEMILRLFTFKCYNSGDYHLNFKSTKKHSISI